MSTRQFNYTLTAEYVGTVEIDDDEGPWEDDDDLDDYLRERVVDDFPSFGKCEVVEIGLDEATRA